jgi:hypothetical protein
MEYHSIFQAGTEERDMRLDWLVIAHDAEVLNTGTIDILGAGLDTFVLPATNAPAELQLYVALRVVAPFHEWTQSGHHLTTTVLTPSGEQRSGYRLHLQETQAPPMLYGDADPGRLLSLLHHIPTDREGIYSILVTIDETTNTFPVRVLFKPTAPM